MNIEFNNLSLKLSNSQILDNVSGTIQKGKITVILGENGAGKSSLLSLLTGIRDNDSGQIKIDGRDIKDLKPKERAKTIGYLSQRSEIHWDISAQYLVGLGRFAHGDDNIEIIHDAMKKCDCYNLKDRIANQLSGGEQSRVMLARVLAGEPQWIFADEPLANLDPAHQLDAINIFKKAAKKGTGVVLVLHDLNISAQIADEIIILKNGRIIAGGDAKEVLSKENIAKAYNVEVFETIGQGGEKIFVPIKRL
ncbi:MAG: ABC transporter ATP-binding protein [Caulobacterales bacterium]|nr:ABC transporter ATP-binding protein [Caulobacterales bacterium]MCA0371366.1 ABC transporter ATP-binding protein [Pseudomonadota bacterium]